ncbi:MAG: hypothetical protein E7476_01830 [Ruminococcaceae bacterium]|nr:hypothetical protein [Oscillospiraceae bacterium]
MSVDSIKNGLSIAKENIVDLVQFGVNFVLVPLIAIAIVALIVFFIALAVRKHGRGDEYQDDIRHIVIALIGLAAVVSFPFWGWAMIDMSSSATSSAAAFLLVRMW